MLSLLDSISAVLTQASGHAEGFPFIPLLLQYINLAILIGVIWWVLKDKIPAAIKQRREGVESGIEATEKLFKQAQENHKASKARLDLLDGELEALKKRYAEEAKTDRQAILTQAKASAERISEEAKIAIKVEFERAVDQLRREAAQDSIDQARATLKEKVDGATQRHLVEKGLAAITNGGA